SATIKTKDKVMVNFILSDGNEVDSLPCEVMNERVSNGKKILGISFIDDKDESVKRIKEFHQRCFDICIKNGSDATLPEDIFPVGFQVDQQIKIKIGEKTVKSTIQGWKKTDKGGFLLVERPGDGRFDESKPGVIVSYVFGGKACMSLMEYQTQMVQHNLWVLKFHGKDVEKSLRESSRIYTMIPVETTYVTGGQVAKGPMGLITDISLSGMGVILKEPLPVKNEETIMVSFSLSEFGSIVSQKMVVLGSDKRQLSYKFFGKFIGLKDEHKSALLDFTNFYNIWSQILVEG
ncbi:MAG: PilZ domain-containing protein, partial [Nitrospinae bacterium]|nr:PilZ domain-containing protein [Nitrospinota bacterium]